MASALVLGAAFCAWLLQPGTDDTQQPAPAAVDGTVAPRATSATPTSPALPARPARDPARLAAQLDLAARTVRDPTSSPGQLEAAARLQQLGTGVVRSLPPAQRRQATAAMGPLARAALRPMLAAAGPLRSLTAAEPRLPEWRIIRPRSPAVLTRHYRRAQAATGVHWTFLAAINLVETRMGRIRGTSTAGAQGPMQFIPGTWDIYGRGGDVNDPADAIPAAARLLRANGAPERMRAALYRYNPSDDYVEAVVQYAQHMQRDPRAYAAYWHWQVLYRHRTGLLLLPEGYPRVRPRRVV